MILEEKFNGIDRSWSNFFLLFMNKILFILLFISLIIILFLTIRIWVFDIHRLIDWFTLILIFLFNLLTFIRYGWIDIFILTDMGVLNMLLICDDLRKMLTNLFILITSMLSCFVLFGLEVF